MSDDPIMRVFRQVLKQKADPRVVVLVAHGLLELMVNTLVKASCKNSHKINSDKRSYPHSAKLLILNECGILDNVTYTVLDRLRNLRNRAAHEPFFSVSKEDVQKIAEPFKNHVMTGIPGHIESMTESLPIFCASMLMQLWHDHYDVLGPAFAPDRYKVRKKKVANQNLHPQSAAGRRLKARSISNVRSHRKKLSSK